jgi:phytoene/squalene synthetase
MADYAHKAVATGMVYIATVAEYDLYYHCVAGLVGEGLTAIWSASVRKPHGSARNSDSPTRWVFCSRRQT